MYCQYEEKTFESYFNTELDKKTSIYFPLGQVQEGVIGLDSVGFSSSWSLWWKLGYPFIFNPVFNGVGLKDIAAEMESHLGEMVSNIPDMKVNLLFQYKRPEYITMASGKEWHLWNDKYYRYKLYPEQHALLSHIENKFGSDALVLYAAPAVENISDLVRLKTNSAIIDNTNFRRASELNGHHRNTYIKAGTFSQACSEPERLENFNLINLIETARATNDVEKRIDRDREVKRNNREFLIGFSNQINMIFRESQKESFLRSAFINRISEYKNMGLEEYPIFNAILTMYVFKEVTGVQWLISLDRKQS